VSRLWAFEVVLIAAGGLLWALTGSGAAGAGVAMSVGAGVVVLGLTGVAVRRNVKAALGFSVLGMALRLGWWVVGFRWVRSRGEDVGAYTLAFFGVLVLALCLEVTYLLVAAGAQRRGAV
jgi:hypothetical protein